MTRRSVGEGTVVLIIAGGVFPLEIIMTSLFRITTPVGCGTGDVGLKGKFSPGSHQSLKGGLGLDFIFDRARFSEEVQYTGLFRRKG